MNLIDLPNERLFDILLPLNYFDLSAACQSNQTFDRICKSDTFWLKKAVFDFGISPSTFSNGNNSDNNSINVVERDRIFPKSSFRGPGSIPEGRNRYLQLWAGHELFPGCQNYQPIQNCLSRAVSSENYQMIDYLLKNGANPSMLLQTVVLNPNNNVVNYIYDNMIVRREEIQEAFMTAGIYDPLFGLLKHVEDLDEEFRRLSKEIIALNEIGESKGFDENIWANILRMHKRVLEIDKIDKYQNADDYEDDDDY